MYSFIAGQTFTTESDTAKISSITVGLRHWQIPTANQGCGGDRKTRQADRCQVRGADSSHREEGS